MTTFRATRRQLLGAAIAGPTLAPDHAVGAATASTPAHRLGARTRQDDAAPATDGEIGQAAAPAWTFVVLAVQDPYGGEVQQPPTPPAGTRYVAAEIVVDNGSDQPLNFNPVEVRLRDAAGIEYRGGTAIGTEPLIGARNLNGGERSRGWLWFTVAEDADLVDLLYLAPPPQFRVDLPPDSDQ